MNVQSASEWQDVQTADLAAGDFFSARIGDTEVMAILAEQDGDRFGVVLSHRGQDADLAAFPPPAGRSLSTLGYRHLKFTGRAIARPTVERSDNTSPGFPGLRTEIAHGDLVLDNGVPWVFVRDHVSSHQVLDYFVNLQTGDVARPAGGAVHAHWELVAMAGDKPGAVLARFGA